jgi:anti-sigma regulatory factor (Ser/Thr protein kinase)
MIVEAASACGAPEAAVTELEVAVGEILSNAQRHAYHGDAGPLEVDIRCDEEAIDLVVHDHGEPLTRAPKVPAGVRLADQDGFGLYIASRLVDVLEIRHPARDNRGTAVRLLKRFE